MKETALWPHYDFCLLSSESGCSLPGQSLENLKTRAKLLLLRGEAASPPLKDLNLTWDPLGPDSFAKYLLSFDAIKASQS